MNKSQRKFSLSSSFILFIFSDFWVSFSFHSRNEQNTDTKLNTKDDDSPSTKDDENKQEQEKENVQDKPKDKDEVISFSELVSFFFLFLWINFLHSIL